MTICQKAAVYLVYFLPEVREFIKDTRPKTNTTRGVWAEGAPKARHESVLTHEFEL